MVQPDRPGFMAGRERHKRRQETSQSFGMELVQPGEGENTHKRDVQRGERWRYAPLDLHARTSQRKTLPGGRHSDLRRRRQPDWNCRWTSINANKSSVFSGVHPVRGHFGGARVFTGTKSAAGTGSFPRRPGTKTRARRSASRICGTSGPPNARSTATISPTSFTHTK